MNQIPAIFDFAFLNPDFEDFIAIAEKINRGSKILIIIENELQRDDIFYTTQFYPFSVFNLKRKMKELKIWNKLVEHTPHLARSKKVFYPSFSLFAKYRAVLADFFYKNKYQKRTQVITHGLRSIFSELKNIAGEGIYFQEYTFNLSRFYIEMLKYFDKNGVEINVNQEVKVEKEHLAFIRSGVEIDVKQIIQNKHVPKTVYEFPFKTPSGFSMFVRHQLGKFRFSEKDGLLMVEPEPALNKMVTNHKLQIVIKDNFQVGVEKMEITEKKHPHFSLKIISALLPKISQSLLSSFQDKSFDDMFELCREKFDLAKQCDINFPEFQILFHRYGKGIDEMIEMAYEKMNKKNAPESLWSAVENDFQKMYEWKM